MAPIINAARSHTTTRNLGGYHWVLLLLAVVVTLLVAAPTITSTPMLYDTSATLKADPQRYASYFSDPEAAKAINNLAQTATEREMTARGFTGFGSGRFGVEIHPQSDGSVVLKVHAPTPAAAEAAANVMADRLMRNIRAAAGRDILRRVMDAEEYRMWKGLASQDRWNDQVRRIIAFGAFDFPVRATEATPALSHEDYNDIARAMEVRYDQLTWRLSDPRQKLTPLEMSDLEGARLALKVFLSQPFPQFQAEATTVGTAYVAALAPLPLAARNRMILPKLAVALVAGIVGGILLVLVDRGIGIVDKLRELWQYRELIRNLVVRDLKARYKNSVLGYFWSLLNPLLMIMLFYFVFKTLMRNPIQNFHIFLMVALLPWNFFAGGLTEGMTSIIGNGNLVKKVYFPREILPISSLLANLINFLLSLPILFFVIALTGGSIAASALLLPLIILIESIFILGIALLLSSLTVFFRDITHIMGILLQLWFFLTPVFYPLEQIGNAWFIRLIRWTNPMASLIDFYRDILYGGLTSRPTPGLPALDGVARTALTVLVVLAVGAYVFHQLSDRFGEEL